MSRCKSKLAQSATNAGVTIILIAVLIVFYILFLSPEDRAELLGDPPPGGGVGPGGVPAGSRGVLLSQTPGRLYPVGEKVVEHTMPSFIVFTTTNANELKRIDSVYLKNSAFTDKIEELVFFFDPKTTSDIKLSFSVRKHSGRLIIWLNDYKIIETEITELSPQPIVLPKDYLQNKNRLVLEVSSPGAAFWRVNEYELTNVLISGKVTDFAGSLSEQHFSITDSEYEKLDRAVFEFLPDCPPREMGNLQMLINNRVIYASPPDCGIKTTIEVSKEFLKPGDNILIGATGYGSFLIDMPKITTFLKEGPQPVFYFNIPNQVYESIYFGEQGILLSLRFADATSIKQGTIDIGGYKMYFEVQDIFYQTFIDPGFINPGPNSIKILPQVDPIDITELRVDIV